MSQEVPSVIFHAQALKILDDLRGSYMAGVGTVDELVVQLRDALNGFQNTVGLPFFDFEPVVDGEPPLSSKINRLWQNLQHDINILQNQSDVSRASAIFTHNLINTELNKAQEANARLSNKIKTLQLYSKAVDTSIVTFGDYFRTDEFVDNAMVPASQQPSFLGESYVTLGQMGDVTDLAVGITPTILGTSNGFPGNWHEVTGEQRTVYYTATNNLTPTYTNNITVTTKESDIQWYATSGALSYPEDVFKAESDPHADITAITSRATAQLTDPTQAAGTRTVDDWFEYEFCKVEKADRDFAGNWNFAYENNIAGSGIVDWATGPPGEVLRLDLQMDLGGIENINFISYTPFNLENNLNNPVKVVRVQTSTDQTNWFAVEPSNIYVTNTTNLQTANPGDEIILGDAIWGFAGRPVRYIQFRLEQAHSVACKIGHLYYQDEADKRVEGPNPVLTAPGRLYSADVRTVGDGKLLQRREVFNGKRWAIGISDITVQRLSYAFESTFVTRPLRVGGIVDRVSLEADIKIPQEYDDTQIWVSFFLSPDDGANWYPISRVQDDYLNVPEIIAFNDPQPVALHEPGIAYYNTGIPVDTLRLKCVMKRPGTLPSTTPVLRSYKLKVKRRT